MSSAFLSTSLRGSASTENLRFLYPKVKVKVKQSRYRPGGAQSVPDFVTTAQDGGRLSALRNGRL